MDNGKDWTEWLSKLPDWVKGVIGLVTLIIGFIVLFRSDIYLSVTVSAALTLIAAFYFSVYLAFSKEQSAIVGGGRVYRFPNYRRWALVVTVLIPIFVIILLVNESTRSFLTVAFTGTATPTATPPPTSTLLPLTPTPDVTQALRLHEEYQHRITPLRDQIEQHFRFLDDHGYDSLADINPSNRDEQNMEIMFTAVTNLTGDIQNILDRQGIAGYRISYDYLYPEFQRKSLAQLGTDIQRIFKDQSLTEAWNELIVRLTDLEPRIFWDRIWYHEIKPGGGHWRILIDDPAVLQEVRSIEDELQTIIELIDDIDSKMSAQ